MDKQIKKSAEAPRMIVVGGVYRHFKGREYRIIAIARHTETAERLVVYRAMDGAELIYVRPYDMFASEIDREKYPDTDHKYRFEPVQPSEAETLPEMVKKGIGMHVYADEPCEICPYVGHKTDFGCTTRILEDAGRYIEQLEERIDLMLLQMRGDCGCCKHKSSGIKNRHGVYGDADICFECLDMWNGKPETYHPRWEYEGLPDITRATDSKEDTDDPYQHQR